MKNRRKFLKISAAVGTGALILSGESLLLVSRALGSVPTVQLPLAGSSIPAFVEPLPTFAGSRVNDTSFTTSMHEFQQKILPESFYKKLKGEFRDGTYVRGYKVGHRAPSYPGHTIEAYAGKPTTITYINNLPQPTRSHLSSLLTVDQTLHWADPLMQMGSTSLYKGSIPTVPHLHGAVVPSAFDGGPNQWFTQDGIHGKGFFTLKSTTANGTIYQYPNAQPAMMLWFHDHALGMTRLNVFAGLATIYLLRDSYDTGLANNPLGLPAADHEIELLIQDRQFDTNGQLLFPDGSPTNNPTGLNGPPPNPGVHPYWIPEFFGDTIVVNGKTWPYLDVEPRRYRFRILNGSNARFYSMYLADSSSQTPGPDFWQIGTDGGLLDQPIKWHGKNADPKLQLFLAPGERADIIVDFASFDGRNLTLFNTANAPFPSGDLPDPATNGRIMQFKVNKRLSSRDATYNPANRTPLRGGANQGPAIVRLADPTTGMLAHSVKPAVKRQLVLVEVEGPGGPIEVLLNNSKWKGVREGTSVPIPGSQTDKMGQGDYLTELPRIGSTEEWEIINLTMDAHPIHLHLVQFQLLNREKFNVEQYRALYDSLFPGGTYAGLKSDGTWGHIPYAPGVYIPGYGPPLLYNTPNATGALGGNPDVTPYLDHDDTLLPDANEAGWKDTLKMYPGQVTRIVARWAPVSVPIDGVQPGQNLFPFDPTVGPGYVWHCHILDHEDNEMMRPYAPVS